MTSLLISVDEMTFEELKRAARGLGFTKVKSEGESVWHDLENWRGWDDPITEDSVYYHLARNKVRAKNALNPGEYRRYTLR